MRAILTADNTLPISVPAICDLVNSTCEHMELVPATSIVRIPTPTISGMKIAALAGNSFSKELQRYDWGFICTGVPYDNNFFFESSGKTVIFSFSGWNLLTDLPVANGILYFIASLLCDSRGEDAHQENTGCVNDFWWDKRGVDVGMRAAFVCADCKQKFGGDRTLLSDAERLLDLVSSASRSGRDVLSITATNARGAYAGFDVFMCHSNEDKPVIRTINQSLRAAGVRTWFDEEQLQPGRPWQPELERQIGEVRAACVFVGRNGRGPWQDMEIRAFLSEFVNRGCPVIPVLLEGAGEAPELPLFLRQMMWVDLRSNPRASLKRLIAALSPRTS
jgi:hypothetical protein